MHQNQSHVNTFTCSTAEPSEKSVEIMRKFSEQYARKSGTYFCADKSVTSVVIKVFSSELHGHCLILSTVRHVFAWIFLFLVPEIMTSVASGCYT